MAKTVSSGPSRRGAGERFEGDLRRALLEAAIALIAEVGAEQVSLREVARRTGVSHSAPAHHFGDKAGLLTGVATEGFEHFAAALRSLPVQRPGAGPVAGLQQLGLGYLEFARAHPAYFDVMFRPHLIDVHDSAYAAASAEAYKVLRAQVEACQAAGWHPDAEARTVTTAAWALVHGLAVLRASGSLDRHHRPVTSEALLAVATALL